VDAKVSEGEKMIETDSDFTDDPGTDPGTESDSEDETEESEGGIIGFVKKNPLIVAGGAGLTIWGLTKVLGGKKKAAGGRKALSGPATRKTKKTRPRSKSKSRARKAKIESIRLT
jgi:hypothetical protein